MGAHVLATRSAEVRVLGPDRSWVDGLLLLATLLGILDRAQTRATLVGALWPDSAKHHACSGLCSPLRRLYGTARDAVGLAPLVLASADGITLDSRQAWAPAHRLLGPVTPSPRADGGPEPDRR